MASPKRALIYTRVSQDRAAGRSVEEQEKESRDFCAREGWTVVEVIQDTVGASRRSRGRRAGWEQVLSLLGSGTVDVLVTWEASRTTRDLEVYAALRKVCVDNQVLWSYSGRTHDMDDSDDRLTTGLAVLIAEREAEETSKRVRRAVRANAVAGRPHGRRLFGYKRVYDPETGRLVGQEPDPAEALVVQEIFDRYLSGEGCRTIARDFKARGVLTGTGAAWQETQVSRVLKNPAYAGRRVHQGEVVGDAAWDPLVEPDTFDKVAAKRAAQAAGRVRHSSTANLLVSVARCGKCGHRLGVQPDRRGRRSYHCLGKYCVARDQIKMDAYVSVVVLERLARPDVQGALAGTAVPTDVVEATTRIDERRAQIQAATDEFIGGSLSAPTLGKIEAELRSKIDEDENLIRQAYLPRSVSIPPTGIDEWWDGLSTERRREVVGALISAVIVKPVQRGTRGFDPGGVDIQWRR